MGVEPHRHNGKSVDGKIELEAGTKLPERAEVTVLFQADGRPDAEDRRRAVQWLLAAMDRGFDLGGGPYVNRTQFYGDGRR